MSSIKEIPTEADVTHWKNMWSDILADPDFRFWILKKPEIAGYFDLKKNLTVKNTTPDDALKKKDIVIKKGTFFMKFGKLGHYVAYEIKNNKIYIFDSSHSTGDESGKYSDCLPPLIPTIKKNYFPNVEFIETFGTPQTLDGDSFCQTWSLAYLIGSPTHKIMKKMNLNNKIETLYKICKYIIDLPVFKEICKDQPDWIKTNFKANKAPKKWDAEYFLHFSRNVLDLNSFHYLFD